MSDNIKKTLTGKVTSNKMDKTIVVEISRRIIHPRYKKVVNKITKLHAHDEGNSCKIGDMVKIVEARPYSKTKAWRLVEIISKAEDLI